MSVSSACPQMLPQSQKMPAYQNYDQQINVQSKQVPKYLTQKSEDPMLSQVKFERDVMLSQAAPTNERLTADSTETAPSLMDESVKEPVVPGTQKTAEKMRKDEGLFVLY